MPEKYKTPSDYEDEKEDLPLEDYLAKSNIIYKGQPLNPGERQRLLDMIKLIFPDRQ
jgi:hypothetical protein